MSKAIEGVGWVLLYLFLITWAVFSILPLLWCFSSSFKEMTEIFRYPPQFLPPRFDLSNYADLIARPFVQWFLNSTAVAVVSVVLICFFCSLAGFAFAKYNFPGRNLLFSIVIGSTMIPFLLIMTPLYAEMITLKWGNTYLALIVPWLAPAFGIFLMRQYMTTVPSELLDSARIDGCTEFRIFAQIALPLAKPGLAALAIFQFLNSWNSYLWPLIILRDIERYTLPLGVATLRSEASNFGGGVIPTDWGVVMAGAFLSAFPLVVGFLFMQRQFISGITLGAVKG
jgi:ABC-type glycerol-3-phosphate transport system permease component